MKKIIILISTFILGAASVCAQTAPTFKDVDYVGDGHVGHKLDIYIPNDGQDTHKVIVLIYGSAWFMNNAKADAYKTMGQILVDNGFAVVSVNHRASTEAKYPAQINDIKAAIRFVRGNAEKYGLDTSFIGATGYSSGGHLSSLAGVTNGVKLYSVGNTTMDIEGNLGQYTSFSSDIDAVVDWFGPVDMARMDNNCTTPKGDGSPEAVFIGSDPLKSPDQVALISAPTFLDLKDPKFVVIHGTSDSVVPYGQGVLFSDQLRQLGLLDEFVSVPGGEHGPVTINENTLQIMVGFFKKQVALKNIGEMQAEEPKK